MRLFGISGKTSDASLAGCLILGLWIGVAGAAEEQVPQRSPELQDEPIEEIAIVGRRALMALRAEIVDAEIRMFGLFNQFNDTREFDIKCETVMVTGSRIPDRECVPTYMKRARRTNAHNFLFSDVTPPNPSDPNRPIGSKSLNTKGVQTNEQELWLQNDPKHKAFNARFRELAAQHPELATAALDLHARRQRLETLEQRQRQEGAMGRFFSRFGGKDEE